MRQIDFLHLECQQSCVDILISGQPGRNLAEWSGVLSSCARLGGFTTGAWICCYDNTAPKAKCQRVLVLLYSWLLLSAFTSRMSSAIW